MHDPDPHVLRRARAGDLHAFEELVRTYQAEVFRFASHLSHDRTLAEDATQEAFLRAFRFIGGLDEDRRFGPWLFAIARNCCYDALRRPRALPLEEEDATASVADMSARAQLDAALRAVSSDHRETFLLVEVLGLSYREAADVLGVATGTVKSRMFRARQALAAAIADHEETST